MAVGVLKLSLYSGEAQSLKDKRRVFLSLKDRIRNSFNVSVAETGFQDMHQRCELTVAAVSNDSAYVNGQFDQILNFIRRDPRISILDYEIEVF